jgi:hypothetical protein
MSTATARDIATLTGFISLVGYRVFPWANPCSIQELRKALKGRMKTVPKAVVLRSYLACCVGERLQIGDQEYTLTNSEGAQYPTEDAKWCLVPEQLDPDALGFGSGLVGLVRDLRICELRDLWAKRGFRSFDEFFDRMCGELSMAKYRRLVAVLGYVAIDPLVVTWYPDRFEGREPIDAPKATWRTYELTLIGSSRVDYDPTLAGLVRQSGYHLKGKVVRRRDEAVSRGHYQWRQPIKDEAEFDPFLRLVLSEVTCANPLSYGPDKAYIRDVTGRLWDPNELVQSLPSEPNEPESSADPWQPQASMATDAA